jgi:hypothetical protein
MIPRRNDVLLTNRVTYEEFQRLLLIRLETLEDATCLVSGGKPIPVQWRAGWRSQLTIVGRSRDGSLCARVEVTSPQLRTAYVRRVRLVRDKSLRLHYR